MSEPPPFVWRGVEVVTIGDLTDVVATIETAEEGAEFMAAYFAVNVYAVQNVGYVAAYHDEPTRQRIWEFTSTAHPIFGRRTPTTDEAFDAGKREAEEWMRRR